MCLSYPKLSYKTHKDPAQNVAQICISPLIHGLWSRNSCLSIFKEWISCFSVSASNTTNTMAPTRRYPSRKATSETSLTVLPQQYLYISDLYHQQLIYRLSTSTELPDLIHGLQEPPSNGNYLQQMNFIQINSNTCLSHSSALS